MRKNVSKVHIWILTVALKLNSKLKVPGLVLSLFALIFVLYFYENFGDGREKNQFVCKWTQF